MARKKYDDDDGRVIASMNVAGMPWSDPLDKTVPGSAEEAEQHRKQQQEIQLERGETAAIMWGAMKAGMIIVLVFGGAGILTVLGFLYWRDIIGFFGNIFRSIGSLFH